MSHFPNPSYEQIDSHRNISHRNIRSHEPRSIPNSLNPSVESVSSDLITQRLLDRAFQATGTHTGHGGAPAGNAPESLAAVGSEFRNDAQRMHGAESRLASRAHQPSSNLEPISSYGNYLNVEPRESSVLHSQANRLGGVESLGTQPFHKGSGGIDPRSRDESQFPSGTSWHQSHQHSTSSISPITSPVHSPVHSSGFSSAIAPARSIERGGNSYHPHSQEHPNSGYGRTENGLGREPDRDGFINQSNSLLPIPVLRALERKDQRLYPHEITDDDVRGAVRSLQAQSLEALNRKVSQDSKLRNPEGPHRGTYAKPASRDAKWDHKTPTRHRGVDVRSIRADFPALHQDVNGHQIVWFDNGATTHKPIAVIEAMTHFYACDYSNIHRAAHTLAARATDHYEGARTTVKEFINAESTDDIVFVRGTTEGINFIAHTCKSFLNEGDEILLTEMEHHANIVPWQLVAEEKRARIRVIPIDDRGDILMDEYRRLLSPRTKLVSVTHASNTLGTIPPVEEMAQMAHRKGAKFIVDGAQSIAHMPVDVKALGCDFFVFSGHKVFAPTGIGAVYIHPDLQELLPPWQGGGNMIHRVSFDGTTFSDPPAKFEAGTPSIGDAVGLGAALRYMQQFDPTALLHHEHVLLEHATRRLEAIPGVRTIGHSAHKVGVVSFVLQGYTTEQVGKELDRFGIAVRTGHHCAQPSLRRFGLESTVRPSFALYNTLDEVDRLADVIQSLARKA